MRAFGPSVKTQCFRSPEVFGSSLATVRPPSPPSATKETLPLSIRAAAQNGVKNIFQCFTLDGEFLCELEEVDPPYELPSASQQIESDSFTIDEEDPSTSRAAE